MIISPPFLPFATDSATPLREAPAGDEVAVGQSTDACADLATTMNECRPGNGAYPLSYNLGWHGGVHLIAEHQPAPANKIVYAEARAIADGVLVYKRAPREIKYEASDPLFYRNAPSHDGVVVLRHTSDIGEGPNASVTFYSITMHLQELASEITHLAIGKRIYRKDRLGVPGYIYGDSGRMHFEIVCDTENLEKLLGRNPTKELNLSEDGRRDAVYGDTYFKLPAGLPIYAERPPVYVHDARLYYDFSTGEQVAERMEPIAVTSELVVRMHYEKDCVMTTLQRDPGHPGQYRQVGQPVITTNGEYDLYKTACNIADGFNRHNTLVQKIFRQQQEMTQPAASALYELLRFGRILNTEQETLNEMPLYPVPHWRKIAYPGGIGWVNLRQFVNGGRFAEPYNCINVYSDADFPPWAGWSVISDDLKMNSLCESDTLRSWLDTNKDGTVTHEEMVASLQDDKIRQRLSKVICYVPTDWSKQTIDARWKWLTQPNPALKEVVSEADFDRLRKHIEALSFWEEAKTNDPGLPDKTTQWHLPPKAIIEHLRKCKWLSESEFKQLLPEWTLREFKNSVLWEEVVEANANEKKNPIFKVHRIPLNKMLHKYGINTPQRMAAFFGNSIQETAWWGKLHENHRSSWYYPWDGRGFLQLTHAENYIAYWKFRGRTVSSDVIGKLRVATSKANADWSSKDREVKNNANKHLADRVSGVTEQLVNWRSQVHGSFEVSKIEGMFSPSDSAGFYWSRMRMEKHVDQKIQIERCGISTNSGKKIYYRSLSFWKAAASINLPGAINRPYDKRLNGFIARCVPWAQALAVLGEPYFPGRDENETFEYPEGHAPRREK